jgi:hypothetical protein
MKLITYYESLINIYIHVDVRKVLRVISGVGSHVSSVIYSRGIAVIALCIKQMPNIETGHFI